MSLHRFVAVLAMLFGTTSCVLAQEAVSALQIENRGGPDIAHVDFERHVASLFGRLGCNSAACHGSFQGKGGLHLSLFGQSPDHDYAAIVGTDRDSSHILIESPNASPMLMKPSGRIEHGGGVRLPALSWEYDLIRRWIASGAKHRPGGGTITTLIIEPSELIAQRVGQSVSLKVTAHFADGDTEDVTAFSDFGSRDETIAEVDATGKLTARHSGRSAVIVRYRSASTSLPVVVPFSSDEPSIAPVPITNLIDEEIASDLVQLQLKPAPPAGDAEFLRRATLDVLGTLPSPETVRSFLVDPADIKRSAAIERLLKDSRRAALWATKMCDITACNVDTMESPEPLRAKRAKMWHDWFRRRFASNVRYDEIVHRVLCATSRQDRTVEAWIDNESELLAAAESGFDSNYAERPSLDLFWRRVGPNGPLAVEDFAELTATAFLGLRLHCARCHQHPYDRWSQRDFAGYAAIFARVQFGSSTELRTAMNQRLDARRASRQQGQLLPELRRVQEVYLSHDRRPLADASSESSAGPQPPGGPAFSEGGDPREALFRWLTQPDNPYFAQNFVNRIWAKYFGAGLVEPVDAFSPGNPATHPRLLERLATEFVRSGYDITHIERIILNSATYQRSSWPVSENATSRGEFALAPIRFLSAETLIDALNAALETQDDFGPDVPAGSQAIELAPNRFTQPRVNQLFQILGRGDRKSLCDCDRAPGPSIRQPLYLMSDPRVLDKIAKGRLSRLVSSQASDAEIVDEFYLATLSRPPMDDERDIALQYIADNSDRLTALTDFVWALVNTREFVTNH